MTVLEMIDELRQWPDDAVMVIWDAKSESGDFGVELEFDEESNEVLIS